MKLAIKHTLGKLEHYNTRIPIVLKRRLETLRKRAEANDIDYAATQVTALEEFADALEAHLNSLERPKLVEIQNESPVNLHNGGSRAES